MSGLRLATKHEHVLRDEVSDLQVGECFPQNPDCSTSCLEVWGFRSASRPGAAEICRNRQLFSVRAPGLRSDLCQGWGQPAMGQAGVLTNASSQMQLELQVVEGGVRLGEGDQSSR